MCWFVTIAVPDHAVPSIRRARPKTLRCLEHPDTRRAPFLPAEYVRLLLVEEHCSCGMYGDPALAAETDPIRIAAQWRKKYAKKGWSLAKIDRAIASRPLLVRHVVGLRADVRTFVADMAQRFGRVGVFVHSYKGLIATEKFTPSSGGLLAPDAFRQHDMPPDQLLWVAVEKRVGARLVQGMRK